MLVEVVSKYHGVPGRMVWCDALAGVELTANRAVLADPEIHTIAQRLGASSAQVIFRFAMQIGMLPLTGTTSQQHMKEDLQAEQFALSTEEIQKD